MAIHYKSSIMFHPRWILSFFLIALVTLAKNTSKVAASAISTTSKSSSADRHEPHRQTSSVAYDNLAIPSTSAALFGNCDIDDYYANQGTDPWDWKRDDIAMLLRATHQNVLQFASAHDVTTENAVNTAPSTSTSATTLTATIEQALADIDRGTRLNNTVRMILSNSEQPISPQSGWVAAYLWPLMQPDDESSLSSSTTSLPDDVTFFAINDNKNEEWVAALADLHNLRPNHPSIYNEQVQMGLFYGLCEICTSNSGSAFNQSNGSENLGRDGTSTTSDKGEGEMDDSPVKARISNSQATDMRSSARAQPQEQDIRSSSNNDSGKTDNAVNTLCLCENEHSLQPPEASRGEIARALLYMELRYGTKTTVSDGLGLGLTDCPRPAIISESDAFEYSTKMGYFSQLVQWHLEYPPSEMERDRNDKICMYYQGNRNPFVDIPQDSWSLLNVEEEEVCPPPAGTGSTQNVSDTSVDGNSTQHNSSDIQGHVEGDSLQENSTACQNLLPGDLNFYLIESSIPTSSGNASDSFGIVTLVDLPSGLCLYVTDNAWMGMDKGFQATEGTLKFEVPSGGIPSGMYFGFGDQMNLGDLWDQVERGDAFSFSLQDSGGEGDQLFLYCTWRETVTNRSSQLTSYNVIAALSTTGNSFEPDGSGKYSNNQSALPESLHENGYGVIILPQDAAQLGTGYQYVGPIFSNPDLYAKALVNQEYWQRTGGTNGLLPESSLSTPEEEASTANSINMETHGSASSTVGFHPWRTSGCIAPLLFMLSARLMTFP